MHMNVHFAVGIIIASITTYFIPTTNIFEYLFIVLCSIGPDFDFILAKFTKEKNHRNFFTHTIYPSLIILVIGIIISNIFGFNYIWIGGLAYISHIGLDCLDWGVKIFYTKNTFGLFLLITQDEKNLHSDLEKFITSEGKEDAFFFIDRYYRNILVLTIDIFLSILGFALMFLFSPQFWYVFFGYFLCLEFHLYQKRKAKKERN